MYSCCWIRSNQNLKFLAIHLKVQYQCSILFKATIMLVRLNNLKLTCTQHPIPARVTVCITTVMEVLSNFKRVQLTLACTITMAPRTSSQTIPMTSTSTGSCKRTLTRFWTWLQRSRTPETCSSRAKTSIKPLENTRRHAGEAQFYIKTFCIS